MKTYKVLPTLIFVLTLGWTINLFMSCSDNKSKESSSADEIKKPTQKYDGVTIEVDISNTNWLSILLAADGTIN